MAKGIVGKMLSISPAKESVEKHLYPPKKVYF